MSILDSSVAPYLIILTIFIVLFGMFRKLLVKVLVTLIVEVLLFVLYPGLLDSLKRLVEYVRSSLA